MTRSSARGCHPRTIMAIMDDPIVGELSALQLPALQVARRISLVISSADSPHKTARFRGHGGGTWPLGDRKSLSKWPLGTSQKHKNPVGDQPRNDRSSRDELGSRQGRLRLMSTHRFVLTSFADCRSGQPQHELPVRSVLRNPLHNGPAAFRARPCAAIYMLCTQTRLAVSP